VQRFTPSAVVTGVKRDAAGNPVEGVTVFADLDGDSVLDPGEPVTVPDAAGQYTLRGLPGGSYPVREVLAAQGGGEGIAATAVPATLLAGDYRSGVDFQNRRVLDVGPDRTADEGAAVAFMSSFYYAGSGSWMYQWSVNGADVPGATGPTFTF